jgi:xanthine dehydrogenase YagS FAD-binding subunit
MRAFEYASPTTTREAIGLLSAKWGETEILAGGTDLLSLMKNTVAQPKRVVNIKGIRELGGISETRAGIRIGATVTLEELHENPLIHGHFHLLAHAAGSVPSMQLRNMGTVGGDLCQRPRCWYFRAGFGLLARDEKGRSLVTAGDNRYHAIFGNSGPACFVCASSLAPALIALGARVRIAGPGGSRELPVQNFFRIPRAEGERETALRPNEILTEILLPASAKGMKGWTYEVRQREALDWPLATASVALRMRGDRVGSAAIVLGHVAPVPWRAPAAERAIAGKPVNEETAAQAGEAAVRGATPLSMNKYKVQLARVAVKRALLAATKPEMGEGMRHGDSE